MFFPQQIFWNIYFTTKRQARVQSDKMEAWKCLVYHQNQISNTNQLFFYYSVLDGSIQENFQLYYQDCSHVTIMEDTGWATLAEIAERRPDNVITQMDLSDGKSGQSR